MKKHYNITVSGRVQGVGFRYYTREKANEAGVKGFVRNKLDRSVYIEAEADEHILDVFLDWCKIGPPSAIVQNVQHTESPLKEFESFEIKS